MMLIWMWLACADAPTVEDISYGDGSVGDALARLEAAVAAQPEQNSDPRIDEIENKLRIIEDRILQLEVAVTDLQTHGVMPATHIGYDPRTTTLDGENVQDALDQLEARLSSVENKVGQDMGEPGPGLFDIPEDRNSNANNQGSQVHPNNQGQPGRRNNQGRQGRPNNQGQNR